MSHKPRNDDGRQKGQPHNDDIGYVKIMLIVVGLRHHLPNNLEDVEGQQAGEVDGDD